MGFCWSLVSTGGGGGGGGYEGVDTRADDLASRGSAAIVTYSARGKRVRLQNA